MARHVLELDMTDLPLVRLSEQKEKRRRGQSFCKFSLVLIFFAIERISGTVFVWYLISVTN